MSQFKKLYCLFVLTIGFMQCSQQIREHKYEFVFAINGNDALDKLQQYPDIDIVLSDINMPEMDGLTLLSRLKEVSPLIKSVIVSAYGDMDNIRIAMNRGAFDFLCKPVNFGDLELTLEKTIQQVIQLHETLRAIKENNILKMYVDETVLDFMHGREFESSLVANETVNATVAFIFQNHLSHFITIERLFYLMIG